MSRSDYYAEEKNLRAPTRSTAGGGGGIKLYGKDLRDLDDADLEGLLSKLSPEELEDLNNDFDPDNSLLPPSQRCRNQTTKKPTGPFQREKLLLYLEETAKKEQDWEEPVPFSPGIKRGKVFEPKEEQSTKKEAGGMEMPIELDVDEDDEIDEALNEAHEKDLVDLAGILGMHNLLNQPQYYNALKVLL
uniref:Tropomodulin n=1 Tax=Parascaris univalens TaxID=6257 RepID=A0A915B3W9_PARUN